MSVTNGKVNQKFLDKFYGGDIDELAEELGIWHRYRKIGPGLYDVPGVDDMIINAKDGGIMANALNLGMVTLKAKEAEEVQRLLKSKGYDAAKKYCKDHQKEIEAVDGHRAWYFLDAALDAGKMKGVYNCGTSKDPVIANALFNQFIHNSLKALNDSVLPEDGEGGEKIAKNGGSDYYLTYGNGKTEHIHVFGEAQFRQRCKSPVNELYGGIKSIKDEYGKNIPIPNEVATNGKPKEVGEMNIIEKKLFDLIAKHPNGPSKLTKSAAVSYKKQAGATDDELDTVLRSYQFNGLADVKNEEETTEEVATNYVPSDNSNTPLAYIKGTLAHVKSNPSSAALEGKAWKVIREKPNYKALAHTTEYKELDKAVGINSEVVPNSVIDKTGREVKIGSKVIIPIMGGGRTYTVSKLGDDGFATCEGEKGDVERVKCKELLVK